MRPRPVLSGEGVCRSGAVRRRILHYYLLDIWQAAFPASWLIPFALYELWRRRREEDVEPAVFFFAMAIGPLILLSFSRAKDSVYLLPAYPALALFLGWWAERYLRQAESRGTRLGFAVFGALAAVTVLSALIVTLILGGAGTLLVLAGMGFVGAMAWWHHHWRQTDPRGVALGLVLLFALGWGLWFGGPIAAWETGRFSNRAMVGKLLQTARGRGLPLYLPNDNLRGGLGLAADRPAKEVDDPLSLVGMLQANAELVAIIRVQAGEIPAELRRAGERYGVGFREEVRVTYGQDHNEVALLSLDAEPAPTASPFHGRGLRQP